MNRQTRYPLVFLVVIFLWLSGTCASMAQALTPNLGPALPAAAVLLSPTGVIVGSYSPTYSWNEVSEATWYYLWINGPSGNVFNQWYQAPDVCGGGTCSVAPPVTLTGGNHTWWIQTWNGAGYGPWSTGMDFSTSMQGTTYYVSPSGNDSNPGTQANPWKTIQKAADTVAASSTVVVQSGNYAERVNIGRSGSMGAPITFQAQETVVMQGFTIQANYITIRGFEITDTPDDSRDGYGIWVQGSGCILENNYVHYATRGGIGLFAQPESESLTANCVVRNNRLYRNSQVGIDVRGRDHLIEGNEVWGTIQYHPKWINPPSWVDADGIRFFGSGHIFRGNYIHDISLADPENINPHIDAFQTWDEDFLKAGNYCVVEKNKIMLGRNTAGFQLAGGTHDLIIRNNIVQAFAGIRAYKRTQSPYTSPSNLFVLNNLFVGDLTYTQWPVGITIANTENVVAKNNIFFDQVDYVIDVANSSGIDVDYNLAYNSDGSVPRSPIGTPIQHNLWGINPLFVNPVAGDYHLQAGSPAIDAGITTPEVIDDYDGIIRPQGTGYDIGAYEFRAP